MRQFAILNKMRATLNPAAAKGCVARPIFLAAPISVGTLLTYRRSRFVARS